MARILLMEGNDSIRPLLRTNLAVAGHTVIAARNGEEGVDLFRRRRQDYRKAWKTACKRTGVSGRLRHDLRRTAVRNLVNARPPRRSSRAQHGHNREVSQGRG